jgi:non-ribosomal peptide synthetase component F
MQSGMKNEAWKFGVRMPLGAFGGLRRSSPDTWGSPSNRAVPVYSVLRASPPAGKRMAVFNNREKSISNLLRAATANNPDGEYLADGKRRLTYREHMAAVGNLAGILRDEYGVRPGDRVGIFAANSLEWVKPQRDSLLVAAAADGFGVNRYP